MKIYEAKSDLCRICNDRQSLLLPICEIDGKTKTFPVCKECYDKIPYKIIPVRSEMSEGYIHVGGLQ